MKSKICHMIILGLFFSVLIGAEAAPAELGESKTEGYALLDDLVENFREMARSGTGGKPKVEQALEGLMTRAVGLKEEQKIDPVFFRRYNRLLAAMKLFIVEDPEGILGPLILSEISEFHLEVMGTELDSKMPLGQVAEAMSEEIINLYLHLDNLEKKEAMRKEFEQGFRTERKK